MKLVIIEDRIVRLEQFVEFDLVGCKSVAIITGKEFDSLIISLESKNTTILDQYACIAAHRSAFTSESRDLIKEYCKTNNKPLILFSGGITSSIFKDLHFPLLYINSKDFYSTKLKLFIENYEKTGSINLLMLQFGLKWKLSLLLNLRDRIAIAQNKQAFKKHYSQIKINDIEVIKRVSDLRINALIKDDLLTAKTRTILMGSEYSNINSEQIQDLKNVINNLINVMA